jgi:predicted RNA-binding protein YlxR (DUF448 family)
LLRLVAVRDEIVPDAAARLPGRGAYLHLDQGCWDRALRRRALTRALRQPGAHPAGGLAEYLAARLPQPAEGTGSVVPGQSGPERARTGRMADVNEKAG